MSTTQTTPPEDTSSEPEVIPAVEDQKPPTDEVKPTQNGLDLIFSMFAKKESAKKTKK